MRGSSVKDVTFSNSSSCLLWAQQVESRRSPSCHSLPDLLPVQKRTPRTPSTTHGEREGAQFRRASDSKQKPHQPFFLQQIPDQRNCPPFHLPPPHPPFLVSQDLGAALQHPFPGPFVFHFLFRLWILQASKSRSIHISIPAVKTPHIGVRNGGHGMRGNHKSLTFKDVFGLFTQFIHGLVLLGILQDQMSPIQMGMVQGLKSILCLL